MNTREGPHLKAPREGYDVGHCALPDGIAGEVDHCQPGELARVQHQLPQQQSALQEAAVRRIGAKHQQQRHKRREDGEGHRRAHHGALGARRGETGISSGGEKTTRVWRMEA